VLLVCLAQDVAVVEGEEGVQDEQEYSDHALLGYVLLDPLGLVVAERVDEVKAGCDALGLHLDRAAGPVSVELGRHGHVVVEAVVELVHEVFVAHARLEVEYFELNEQSARLQNQLVALLFEQHVDPFELLNHLAEIGGADRADQQLVSVDFSQFKHVLHLTQLRRIRLVVDQLVVVVLVHQQLLDVLQLHVFGELTQPLSGVFKFLKKLEFVQNFLHNLPLRIDVQTIALSGRFAVLA